MDLPQASRSRHSLSLVDTIPQPESVEGGDLADDQASPERLSVNEGESIRPARLAPKSATRLLGPLTTASRESDDRQPHPECLPLSKFLCQPAATCRHHRPWSKRRPSRFWRSVPQGLPCFRPRNRTPPQRGHPVCWLGGSDTFTTNVRGHPDEVGEPLARRCVATKSAVDSPVHTAAVPPKSFCV